jgi:hypothetical protein
MTITCIHCHQRIWPDAVPNVWNGEQPCTHDHHAPEGVR